MNMKYKDRKAQIIIETTVALMIILMLMIGATKVFIYYSSSISQRHENYQKIRKVQGQYGIGYTSDGLGSTGGADMDVAASGLTDDQPLGGSSWAEGSRKPSQFMDYIATLNDDIEDPDFIPSLDDIR